MLLKSLALLFVSVSMVAFTSDTSQASTLDFKSASKAFTSAPVVSLQALVGTWTMIGLSTPDSHLATAPNGDYRASDGVMVRDTHVIDLSLACSYNTVESVSGRTRSTLTNKGRLTGGSFVLDLPNSGCHQVDTCRVLIAGHLLCKTEFLDTADECDEIGGKGAQMYIEYQR